ALHPNDSVARESVEQAKQAIAGGRFDDAHRLLADARQAQVAAAMRAREAARQAQAVGDAEMLDAAASTATEADLAMTELDYLRAADLYGKAEELVPPGHPDEAENYLHGRAYALHRQGDDHGDKAALLQAIATYNRALEQLPRERSPKAWAATQ